MTRPDFFGKQWAGVVRDALAAAGAGPRERARAGKLQEYWDFFEQIKGGYPASWALGCRTCPPSSAAAQRTFPSSGTAARSPAARSSPDAPPKATYVLGMDRR